MARATEQTTTGLRQGSPSKRTAILDAAEALFVSEGYELTSVDTIAARAKVSKRTVYDYFGDKQTLFDSALARVGDSLVATVHAVVEDEFTEGRDLRDALMGFALRVATEAFPSSEFVAYRNLNAQGRQAPALGAGQEQPERMLEELFQKLAAAGELRTDNPRRAVQHFTALTLLIALDALRAGPTGAASKGGESEIPAIIADGVDAFLRAYR
ncbi:hypothetical protein GCM10027570_40630 [Streptomonospora sediminis]